MIHTTLSSTTRRLICATFLLFSAFLFPFMSVVEAMQEYVDAGLTTFDMADIYGPAEEIFGQFNSQVSVYILNSVLLTHRQITTAVTSNHFIL